MASRLKRGQTGGKTNENQADKGIPHFRQFLLRTDILRHKRAGENKEAQLEKAHYLNRNSQNKE